VFGGLIEEMGAVQGRQGGRFTFAATVVAEDAKVGDSIAVSGCCLTVTGFSQGCWQAEAVDETLARTTLSDLGPGDPVNLERALRLGDRVGGHLVAGHVDGVAEVVVGPPDLAVVLPRGLDRYVVEKGSVAIDGVSLTVVAVEPDGVVRVAVVPHTAEVTTLGLLRPGDKVNVEVDLVAKHVERLLEAR